MLLDLRPINKVFRSGSKDLVRCPSTETQRSGSCWRLSPPDRSARGRGRGRGRFVGDGGELLFSPGLVAGGLDSIARSAWLLPSSSGGPGTTTSRLDPLARGGFRTGGDGAVGDQGEQHPLDVGAEPASVQGLGERGVDAERLPLP